MALARLAPCSLLHLRGNARHRPLVHRLAPPMAPPALEPSPDSTLCPGTPAARLSPHCLDTAPTQKRAAWRMPLLAEGYQPGPMAELTVQSLWLDPPFSPPCSPGAERRLTAWALSSGDFLEASRRGLLACSVPLLSLNELPDRFA